MGALREPVFGRRDASPVPPKHVSSTVQANAARLGLRSARVTAAGSSPAPTPTPAVAVSPGELRAPGCARGWLREPEKRKRAREKMWERKHEKAQP